MTATDIFGVDSIQRLLDERSIRTTLAHYARGADRQDFTLLRSVYHPDARDHHGFYDGDVDGFLEWFETRHRDVVQSMHLLANCLIDFLSATSAAVETYCVTYQRTRDRTLEAGRVNETAVLCRFVDHFDCREGAWKVAERTVVYETAAISVVDEAAPFPPGVLVQRHGMDDPGWLALNKLAP